MSGSLLRQARLAHSLSAARRPVLRCCRFSALSALPRHEPEQEDSAPVAGPSTADAFADIDIPDRISRSEERLRAHKDSRADPTLEDLEEYRPATRPALHSPKYITAYNALTESLCRAFTKEQLRKFLVQALGTSRHCSTSRRKAEYAESILEQIWKWPTLRELEQAKRDRTEITNKMLPMTASELFLVLGKDGQDLLRMSQDFDVHLSLRQEPLALRVEGPRGAVAGVANHIQTVKQTFTEELYTMPTPAVIPEDMVQRISRSAQAYLENIPSQPGKIRMYAKDAHGLETAKRLASRAIHEIVEDSETSLLTHLPAGTAAHAAQPLVMFPHAYAFYPHFSPRALPITVNNNGAFRLRRVGEWLRSGFHEDSNTTGGLASEEGHIVTGLDISVTLKDALLQALPETSPGSQTTIKASLGHLLLTRVSKDQRTTLVPPLTGEHPFGKIRKWISNNPVKMSFVPGVPLPLLNANPTGQKVVHRLVYHSVSSISGNSEILPTHRRHFISFEATMGGPKDVKPEDPYLARAALDPFQSFDEDASPHSKSELSALDLSSTRCWAGVQVDLDLMMPDRPMDLQFTVSNSADLSDSQQPVELQRYAQDLRAFLSGSESQQEQPTPPFLFEHAGTSFILRSNASVRRSVETVAESAGVTLREIESASSDLTHAICENMLDLESNEKSVHCEVVCQNPTSEASWKHFLVDCDRLTLMTHHHSSNSESFLDKPIESL